MQLSKLLFYGGLFILLVTYGILNLTGSNAFFLTQVISCVFALYLNGLFTLTIAKAKFSSVSEQTIHAVGLSILLLVLAGLGINTILPLLGILKPLTATILQTTFLLLSGSLLFGAYFRSNATYFIPKLNLFQKYAILPLIFFPLISIAGANRLNNGFNNSFTFYLLLAVPMYLFIFSFYRKKLGAFFYPLILYSFAVCVLFMLSLRSYYISGFDISTEYEVFQFTKNAGYWTMANYRNAYNACMSITILPTFLQLVTKIPDAYIYKFLYPLIFALIPVTMYQYISGFAKKEVAFLAGFFIIVQPWYIDPMTTIARQEISFFFFLLIISALFTKQKSNLQKNFLVLSAILGMVLSHYSTTYVTNVLFVGSFGFLTILYVFGRFCPIPNRLLWFKERFSKGIFNLHIGHLVFLILATFIWYSQITGVSNNLNDFFRKTLNSFHTLFTNEQRAGILNQVALKDTPSIQANIYDIIYQQKTDEYIGKKDVSLVNDPQYKDFKLQPAQTKQNPVKDEVLFTAINKVYKATLALIQIFLGLGCLYVFLYNFWKNKSLPVDYIVFAAVSGLLLVSIVVVPSLSLSYNFDRMYLHTMFILTYAEVLIAFKIFQFISQKKAGFQLSLLNYILVFLFTFSVIWQFTGGKTVVWLNNKGIFYDLTYTTKAETLAAKFIGENYDFNTIYVDAPGRNKIAAYALKNNLNYYFFPSIIGYQSYVYFTAMTVENKTSYFENRGVNLPYQVPIEFFDKNKNKIYDAGSSEVYK